MAIVNNATASMGTLTSLRNTNFNSFKYIPGVKLVDHVIVKFLILLRKLHPIVPQWSYQKEAGLKRLYCLISTMTFWKRPNSRDSKKSVASKV